MGPRRSAAEGVDTGGSRLGNVLEGRGSGGKDVNGRRTVVREHVGPRVPGDWVAAVGRGATREATGGGGGRRVADDGESGGTSGRNDRRLKDKPVGCDGSVCGYTLNGGGLNGRRRSRVSPRLLLLVGADGFGGTVDDGAQDLRVSGPGLALATSPDVTSERR